tara:strand:- start:10491 stop:11147 length:657 start_codon:yes stop_codon:yes gene_type:complete
MNIYIDIETIGGKREAVPDEFLKVAANLKDPEKIEAARVLALEKTSFNGAFGEIVSIAWAVDGDKVNCFNREGEDDSEKWMLEKFFMAVEQAINRHRTSSENFGYKWIGHFIQFDLGFLFKRAKILGVDMRSVNLPWPVNSWDKQVVDTMYLWAGRDTVSLDVLAFVLLGERKIESGADVAFYWSEHEFKKIRLYNIDDVEKTRNVHKILAPKGSINF